MTDNEFPLEHHFPFIEKVATEDAVSLNKAERIYGCSWKLRGGGGVFHNLARKWDRLENAAKKYDYDVFKAIAEDSRAEGAIDDIRDLRRYLLLLEAEMRARGVVTGKQAGSAAEDKPPQLAVPSTIDCDAPGVWPDADGQPTVNGQKWSYYPDGIARNTKFLPNGKIWDAERGVRARNVADMTDLEIEKAYAERRSEQHP